MAKQLEDIPITSSDLTEYLDSQSDFNFELRVLKMLRESGIDCEHGGHYEDPVTKKSREFDIRAIQTIGEMRVRMAIECKNIRDNFPILISCVPRHESESYHQVALLNDGAGNLFSSIGRSRATTFTIKNSHSLYKIGEPVGKSTVQVGRQKNGDSLVANDSELFDKWGQCLNSSHDLVERTYWDGENEGRIYKSAVIPFVVVPNDRLWETVYGEDGTRVLDPISTDRCSCYIDKDYVMGTKIASERIWLSHMEIVTFNGLRSFIEQYLKHKESMESIFPREGIKEAVERSMQANNKA